MSPRAEWLTVASRYDAAAADYEARSMLGCAAIAREIAQQARNAATRFEEPKR